MERPDYRANPVDRCYHCKHELYTVLTGLARTRGVTTIVDGSNADDRSDYRPGRKAAREFGVRSPLDEADLTKAEIRELSRAAGLPTWDEPASACLSSRIPYHSEVTEAKLQAIESLHAAGLKITPVVTIVNGVNNDGVGPIVDFCMEHHDKVGGPAFQPVSFTGRDEGISDADRLRQRYTTSHLAHDLARYYDGRIDPLRDWYPLGAAGAFAALSDHLRGPDQRFGQLSCSCHPNCGASLMMVLNRRTRSWAPVSAFFDIERFMADIDVIVDTARGRALSFTQVALSFLRNFDQRKAPDRPRRTR